MSKFLRSGSLEEYLSRTQKSRHIWEESKKLIPDGVFRNWYFFKPYPFYVVRAEGSRIYDVDGNEYIDFCNNAGSLILGHAHPRVVSAIKSVIEKGLLSSIGPTELDFKYAEMIHRANPCAEKIRVTTSGTEAVMYATRLARAYTRKNKIAKFEGQYSGSSDFIYFSVTPTIDSPLPPTPVLDSEGIPSTVTDYQISLPWNDIHTTENIIKKERKNLAAVIVDPCMRAITPPEKDFLKALREVTSENDILLIADEVASGFRLSYRGAYGYFGLVPDIVVYGKIAGGGFPLGVFASNEEIISLVCSEGGKVRVPHSGTFSGHPFAIEAGYATLCELYEHPEIYDRINIFGNRIRKGLSEIFEDNKLDAIVGGYASIFRIFFTEKKLIMSYRDIADSVKRLEEAFRLELISRGIYMSVWSNLSAAITKDDVELMLEAAGNAIRSVRYEHAPF